MTTRVLALLAITFALHAAAATAAAPQLAVVGNHLVDTSTGQTFVPRGVNWPSFEYACTDATFDYSNDGYGGQVAPDATDANLIAGWHANVVRVPLNEACWLGYDGQPAFGTVNGYRGAVQDWVNTLHAAGLAVILDLHWSAPDQTGVTADGERATPDSRSPEFWASIAAAFKSDHAVMFDLFNEPYSRYKDNGTPIFELTWDCWLNGDQAGSPCTPPEVNDNQSPDGKTYPAVGMQALLNAVKASGATQPVLLAGRDYANDLGDWLNHKPAYDQVVASFHAYDEQACHTPACYDTTIGPLAQQVPVIITEFGESDCKDTGLTATMDWGDAHGVGYLGWGWVVEADQPACSHIALLDKADGTPRAPNGTALKAHLAAFAPPGSGGTGGGGGAGGGGAGGSGSSTTPGATGPGSGSGSGGAGGGSGSGPGGAGALLHLAIGGKKVQRLAAAIAFTVICDRACQPRAGGYLSTTVRGQRKRFRLHSVSAIVPPGRIAQLKLRLSRAARKAAAAALHHRRRATVAVTVTAGGATTKRSIRLKL